MEVVKIDRLAMQECSRKTFSSDTQQITDFNSSNKNESYKMYFY